MESNAPRASLTADMFPCTDAWDDMSWLMPVGPDSLMPAAPTDRDGVPTLSTLFPDLTSPVSLLETQRAPDAMVQQIRAHPLYAEVLRLQSELMTRAARFADDANAPPLTSSFIEEGSLVTDWLVDTGDEELDEFMVGCVEFQQDFSRDAVDFLNEADGAVTRALDDVLRARPGQRFPDDPGHDVASTSTKRFRSRGGERTSRLAELEARLGKKRPRRFTAAQTQRLKDWLYAHRENPYASVEEQQALADECGLQRAQVMTWLINARGRILQR